MTATAFAPRDQIFRSRLFLSLDEQDRNDLLFLIDGAGVKARTPLGERLAQLRVRLDVRRR